MLLRLVRIVPNQRQQQTCKGRVQPGRLAKQQQQLHQTQTQTKGVLRQLLLLLRQLLLVPAVIWMLEVLEVLLLLQLLEPSVKKRQLQHPQQERQGSLQHLLLQQQQQLRQLLQAGL